LYFALLSFTRADLALAISNTASSGVYTAGIQNDTTGASAVVFNTIYNTIGSNITIYNAAALPGIMHHKYLIVDQGNANSDPLVLTGSHNWSTSANSRNDENTLIIHDENLANQYYQEFVDMMNENGVAVGIDNIESVTNFITYPNPALDFVNADFISKTSETYTYFISDMTGKVFFSKEFTAQVGQNSFYVQIKNLSAGIYFLKLQNESGIAVSKLIKH